MVVSNNHHALYIVMRKDDKQMLLLKEPFFCDPLHDKALPVRELFTTDYEKELSVDYFYLIDDTLYEYVGNVTYMDSTPNGCIFKYGGVLYVKEHDDATVELYNERFIVEQAVYEARTGTTGLEAALVEYAKSLHQQTNIMKAGNIKVVPSGNVYMPELLPDDDPLERIVKLMLRSMKIVLNDHRGCFDKKHQIDNIKSALNGATKNMSITKFLSWCKNFDWGWEFIFDNAYPNVPSPLSAPVVIDSMFPMPWVEIPPETKTCFTVPLVDGEDPLKRGIKLVLADKRIDIKDYKKKSPTPHLINNMKSALKSKQKMTMLYCLSWCEIIDLQYSFRITNKETGIWYRIVGYDVTTNGNEE